jgi:hypothetical protein
MVESMDYSYRRRVKVVILIGLHNVNEDDNDSSFNNSNIKL